ncbi:hypothetical protein HG536_0B03150 [Torulaspora globosa]|uniref:protein-tyrosine-phosphatase n=1 Tax=Torulaspora globosa TaxID=48254 RepID=A0A7G3ZD66_9SACH|nr:uncharacterized protein HG536_0B03150 [Torulaspora globosa]QLL31452.1 hypothetical protein HG536_0B03150 [Torulaspora globosa]
MAQEAEETMATPSSGLDIRSKSPRSLQSRNTKNLSLSIQESITSSVTDFQDAQGCVPSVVTKPIAIDREMTKNGTADQQLQSRRTEASIYALPTGARSGSTSPIYSPSGLRSPDNGVAPGDKVGRAHSLSLSVKTKELGSSLLPGERVKTMYSVFETSTPKSNHFGSKDGRSWPTGVDRGTSDVTLSYPEAIKGDAYPSGPLMVIPPNVYLYSEPKLEEILDFDVVINVAKEVPNMKQLVPGTKSISYHHVEWSHNSKISTDLDYLTDLIHKASATSKKVLIHCQCGVSRSASLVVAYIMRYHNLGLNDAYNHVKGIAKDISPNMSLIFQLMEWNELRNKTPRQPEEAETRDMSTSSTSPTNDLTIVSPESTPRTPGEFFNKVSTASSSSTASTSSTIIVSQNQSKPVALSPGLGNYLSTDISAPSPTDNFWSRFDAV